MKEAIKRFFAGRYGYDPLNRAILTLAIILLFVNMFLGWSITYFLGVVALLIGIFRSLSKNIEKRSAENAVYLKGTTKIRGRLFSVRERIGNRKTHKYYSCPSCGQQLRVPRGKGRISIKCPKCGMAFVKET